MPQNNTHRENRSRRKLHSDGNEEDGHQEGRHIIGSYRYDRSE